MALEPQLAGGFLGDVADQLVGHLGENLVHKLVAAGVIVWEGHRVGEALAMDGDDPLAERFPGQALFVDVADEVAAGVALAEPYRLAVAVDPRCAARLFEQPLFDGAWCVATGAHVRIQSVRRGGRPSWAARAR